MKRASERERERGLPEMELTDKGIHKLKTKLIIVRGNIQAVGVTEDNAKNR